MSESVKCLLKYGALINSKNESGLTPLHIAASLGWLEVVKCLIENGARVDVKDDKEGRTPFFFAMRQDQTDVVNYLTLAKKRKAEKEPEASLSYDPAITHRAVTSISLIEGKSTLVMGWVPESPIFG